LQKSKILPDYSYLIDKNDIHKYIGKLNLPIDKNEISKYIGQLNLSIDDDNINNLKIINMIYFYSYNYDIYDFIQIRNRMKNLFLMKNNISNDFLNKIINKLEIDELIYIPHNKDNIEKINESNAKEIMKIINNDNIIDYKKYVSLSVDKYWSIKYINSYYDNIGKELIKKYFIVDKEKKL